MLCTICHDEATLQNFQWCHKCGDMYTVVSYMHCVICGFIKLYKHELEVMKYISYVMQYELYNHLTPRLGGYKPDIALVA